MKKLLLSTLLSTLLFSATPEQVERYLSISNADEQLVELESQFSQMQRNLNRNREEAPTYDMQMLSIRFKEYLQKHLSEDEMEEILQQYKNVLLLQFVSASAESQKDTEGMEKYLKELESDPQAQARKKLVRKISDEMYNKESMTVMFDNLIKPLMENAPGGGELSKELLKKSRESYVKRMIEETQKETLYATRDFTMEELEELEQIAKSPAIDKETKAIFGATAYALQEFFLSLAKRYDISKHQPEQTTH
ncbi:MAG: hypothetical protein L3J47_09730 [Sulfurovum sp.]|nr:hypothetical protein [Sulfurovum sp.]